MRFYNSKNSKNYWCVSVFFSLCSRFKRANKASIQLATYCISAKSVWVDVFDLWTTRTIDFALAIEWKRVYFQLEIDAAHHFQFDYWCALVLIITDFYRIVLPLWLSSFPVDKCDGSETLRILVCVCWNHYSSSCVVHKNTSLQMEIIFFRLNSISFDSFYGRNGVQLSKVLLDKYMNSKRPHSVNLCVRINHVTTSNNLNDILNTFHQPQPGAEQTNELMKGMHIWKTTNLRTPLEMKRKRVFKMAIEWHRTVYRHGLHSTKNMWKLINGFWLINFPVKIPWFFSPFTYRFVSN